MSTTRHAHERYEPRALSLVPALLREAWDLWDESARAASPELIVNDCSEYPGADAEAESAALRVRAIAAFRAAGWVEGTRLPLRPMVRS